jgi:hypothetical protein
MDTMFGIAYLKAPPTTYVLHFKAGRIKREGAGLSFLYYAPTSTVTLVPLQSADVPFVFQIVTRDFQAITLAEARLSDGQRLLGFNDLFIGARSHVSARYRLEAGGKREAQSSSGVLVSTGAGSTGWLSSVFNMAAGLAAFTGGTAGAPPRLTWEDPRLVYVVREPYASRHSQATMVAGVLQAGQRLTVESLMPSGGVIFSDGVEADALAFNSGVVATIGAAAQRTRLVVA